MFMFMYGGARWRKLFHVPGCAAAGLVKPAGHRVARVPLCDALSLHKSASIMQAAPRSAAWEPNALMCRVAWAVGAVERTVLHLPVKLARPMARSDMTRRVVALNGGFRVLRALQPTQLLYD